MFPQNRINGQCEKPQLTSYDSGYEHSIEHCIKLRLLVDEQQAIEATEVRLENRLWFSRPVHDQSAFIAWAQRIEHKRVEDRLRSSRPVHDQSAFIAWAQGIEHNRKLEISA